MPAFQNLTGQRFSRLVVIERAPNRGVKVIWRCICDCGKECMAHATSLRSGVHRSCGCLHMDTVSKHGQSLTLGYASWLSMKQRCSNPNAAHYERYGGRGITFCTRWSDFTNFIADMGERPSINYTLERIDNNAGYSPENCRWATKKEQAQNRKIVTPDWVNRDPATGRFVG